MAAQRHGLACRERGFNSRCSHQGNHIYLFSQPRKRFKTGWQPGTDWHLPADEKAVLRAVLAVSVISGFNSPRWAGVTEGIPGTPDGNVGRCAPGELRSWQPGKTGDMRHCCNGAKPAGRSLRRRRRSRFNSDMPRQTVSGAKPSPYWSGGRVLQVTREKPAILPPTDSVER